MLLSSLPADILILILRNLSVPELGKLACTDRFFKTFIDEYGWSGYLRSNPRPSYSLSQARSSWSSKAKAYFDTLTDAAWQDSNFVARPLSRPWRGKLQPILSINSSRLFVAAGHTIYSYKFTGARGEKQSPPVISEASFTIPPPSNALRDVTSSTTVNDCSSDDTIYLGFQDGSLERVTLTDSPSNGSSSLAFVRNRVGPFGHHIDLIESLSASQDFLLSLTTNGHATLSPIDSHHSSFSSIKLDTRSWVCHLCLHATDRYAAFGTHSSSPLTVHSIAEDGLRQSPTAILQPKLSSTPQSLNAVYGITQAPTSAPWGSSPQVLVSGWFDGVVKCYDLRSSLRSDHAAQSSSSPIPLRPILELSDPLADEAIYSVSCGGGSSSYIAAGTARHSVVSFWDVRSPKAGWSVYAPGNDHSPVYSVILESSRLFGVTQSRPFVYDFGPGVTSTTYPSLPRGVDGLKYKEGRGRNEPGFYVTTYQHHPSADH
ncbi:hypothetical protein JOM56_010600 [Amanita muscaria]